MSAANLVTNAALKPDTASAVAAPANAGQAARGARIIVQDRIIIPPGIDDFDSFCRWAHSEDFPASGWVSYLDGVIWVDPDMEEFLTHNGVKAAYTYSIMHLLHGDPRGKFVPDRMLLTNADAGLATEPDGLMYLWSTMQAGRLRMVPGKKKGFMELEGTPDIVLEIISESSARKDKEVLRELYWKAKIAEYWLVDARTDPAQFDILRHTEHGYVETPAADGWMTSQVLGRQFRLVRQIDPLGHPQFVVEVREVVA